METTVALVAVADRPLSGCIAYLRSPTLPGGFLFGITNADGYAAFDGVPVPFSGVLQLAGACQYYEHAITVTAVNVTLRVGPSPPNPQDLQLPACVPFRRPFQIAPRIWKGNLCGVRIPGLAPVEGGAADPSLVLSWFYDRYDQRERMRILETWRGRGYTHVALSWPDSRAFGRTPAQFLATCQELIANGLSPCVFLTSKDYDPRDVPAIVAGLADVLPRLVGVVPLFCVGWELSLWLSPHQVQDLIDALAPQWLRQPGTRGYVHFQEGYFAYQLPGLTTADFWHANVGTLHGVLHQRALAWDPAMYQARITDCLQRFAGGYNFPSDSGFGTPFEFVAFEITAALQFTGAMSEAEGDAFGQTAITTPPSGDVRVLGSGNGS